MYSIIDSSSRAVLSQIAIFQSSSILSAEPGACALESSPASGDVSSAFSAGLRESPSVPPPLRPQPPKKSVSFTFPDDLFSESDCAAAVLKHEAYDSRDEEGHDYARTLAGTLARRRTFISMRISFHVFNLPSDLSWMLLWGGGDDDVVRCKPCSFATALQV
jgi:hypothetical protein